MEKEELSQLKIARSPDAGTSYRRSGKKKAAWIMVALAILFLLGFLYFQGLLAPAPEVEITSVSLVYPAQPLTQLSASGYVVAQRKAAVASKGTGRLEFLAVEEGSGSRKGKSSPAWKTPTCKPRSTRPRQP